MVSGFQDELDPDDAEPSLSLSQDIILTSDKEEEGVPAAPSITNDQDLNSETRLKA